MEGEVKFPPMPGWMKCNIYGSSDGAPGRSTASGVFRTSRAFVQMCFTHKVGPMFTFEVDLVAAMMWLF